MSFNGNPNIEQHRLKPQGERYYYSSTEWFFNLQDLDRLRGLVGQLEAGTVRASHEPQSVQPELRSSMVSFIEPTADSGWLYEKIGEAIRFHNQTYYGYDITGIEHLQFTEYPAGEGFYKPHMDWGSGMVMGRGDLCRKLSFSIQLSNPDSYEGGDFRILNGQDFTQQSEKLRQFGTIVVFPSWILHEVTPVTRGTRRSLVGWCVGPDFR